MSGHSPGPWKLNPTVRSPRSDIDKELDINPKGGWLEIATGDICNAKTGEPICKPYNTRDVPILEAVPELLRALNLAIGELIQMEGANEPGGPSDKATKRAIKEGLAAIKKATTVRKERKGKHQ